MKTCYIIVCYKGIKPIKEYTMKWWLHLSIDYDMEDFKSLKLYIHCYVSYKNNTWKVNIKLQCSLGLSNGRITNKKCNILIKTSNIERYAINNNIYNTRDYLSIQTYINAGTCSIIHLHYDTQAIIYKQAFWYRHHCILKLSTSIYIFV